MCAANATGTPRATRPTTTSSTVERERSIQGFPCASTCTGATGWRAGRVRHSQTGLPATARITDRPAFGATGTSPPTGGLRHRRLARNYGATAPRDGSTSPDRTCDLAAARTRADAGARGRRRVHARNKLEIQQKRGSNPDPRCRSKRSGIRNEKESDASPPRPDDPGNSCLRLRRARCGIPRRRRWAYRLGLPASRPTTRDIAGDGKIDQTDLDKLERNLDKTDASPGLVGRRRRRPERRPARSPWPTWP